LLAQAALVLEAQPVVEREAGAHAPVVLGISTAVVEVIEPIAAVVVDRAAARGPEEKAREIVSADTAGSGRQLILECVGAGSLVEQRGRDLHPSKITPELPCVTSDELRQGSVDGDRALPRDRRRIEVLTDI